MMLAGCTAVVTGASSGLGRHFATVLDAAGANVVIAARRRSLLDALAEEIPRSTVVECDVTDEEDVKRLVAAAISVSAGRLVLVNNAGGAEATQATQLTTSGFEASLAVNLTATFGLATAFAPIMSADGGGSIVNIASMFGLVAAAPIPHAAYCAAKAGVIGLTRQLGCEWARDGVRVNALAPGWFPSDLTSEFFADERGGEYVQRNTPMGRAGELHELDGPLLLLAGDRGSYITGQTLVVDGGWTAR